VVEKKGPGEVASGESERVKESVSYTFCCVAVSRKRLTLLYFEIEEYFGI
jgi:hypothetical protein